MWCRSPNHSHKHLTATSLFNKTCIDVFNHNNVIFFNFTVIFINFVIKIRKIFPTNKHSKNNQNFVLYFNFQVSCCDVSLTANQRSFKFARQAVCANEKSFIMHVNKCDATKTNLIFDIFNVK